MQDVRKIQYFEKGLKAERFVLGKERQAVQVLFSLEYFLDRLMDKNIQRFLDDQECVENTMFRKMQADRLHTALSLLTPEEQALIRALSLMSSRRASWQLNFVFPFTSFIRGK